VVKKSTEALEKLGTSRAAMLADFGSLSAFRDWLAGRIAATDRQAGVPIATKQYREWHAIFAQYPRYNGMRVIFLTGTRYCNESA
jgi:hypothetical protein